jgi:hypothetical protein
VFLFVWHLVKHLKTKPYESILLLFIFGYIGAFLYLTSATGINEVNQRTLFYPLFVVLLFLIYKVVKSEVVMLRTGLFVVLLTIGFFNFLKLNQTYKRFVTTGYGELASSFLKAKNQTFENAIKLIKEKNIKSENIYTNRHKLLPIYLNFVLLKELPTNRQWLGNKHWYLSDKEIELKLSEIKLSMQENNSIIIFVGSDSDKVFQNYYTDLSKYFALLQYEDGFIIY